MSPRRRRPAPDEQDPRTPRGRSGPAGPCAPTPRSGDAAAGGGRSTDLRPVGAGWPGPGGARFPLAAPTWPGSVPRPAPDPELGVHYDTAWSRRYPVRLARAMVLDNVTRPLARVLASPQLRGEEGLVDLEAPVIFAANHASHVDTPLLLACLPLRFRHRTVVAAAADYFFDRRWKADAFSFLLGAIPIERTKVNRRSADLAAELLADDWNLVIFPEGGRSPDGWAQEFRGRCRLPGVAHRAAGGAGPPRRHPPHPAQGRRHGPPHPDHGHLRHPAVAGRGRGRPQVRRPHRGRGGHAGQRVDHRLVDGPQAGGGRHHPVAAGSRRRRLAPVVGPRPVAGPRPSPSTPRATTGPASGPEPTAHPPSWATPSVTIRSNRSAIDGRTASPRSASGPPVR